MTTTPIPVTTDLNQALERINQNLADFRQETNQNLADFRQETNQKLDNINKEITNIKIEVTEVKGEIKVLDNKVDNLDKRLEKLETSQKNQTWSLIGILATAVLGILVASVKILFFSSNL